MIDPQSQSLLLALLQRESMSFLLYIGDSFPVTSAGESTLRQLQKIVRNEANAISNVGKFLLRQRVTPPPRTPYPMGYTSWNFMSLEFLMPKLIEAEKQSIDALQADLSRIAAEYRRPAEELLGVKRMNLAALEGLAVQLKPEPVPA